MVFANVAVDHPKRILNFDVGLVLGSTQHCRVSGLTIEDCRGHGVNVIGGIDGSESNVFEDSFILLCRHANRGFYLQVQSGVGSSGHTFERNVVNFNSEEDIEINVTGTAAHP